MTKFLGKEMKNRILSVFCILMGLVLVSCSGKTKSNPSETADTSAPVYSRSVMELDVPGEYNPYIIYANDKGIFYYVSDVEEVNDVYSNQYKLFFTGYEDNVAEPVGEMTGGYIRGISLYDHAESNEFYVYSIGESATVKKYINGENTKTIDLPDYLNVMEEFPDFVYLGDDRFAFSLNDKVYLTDENGKTDLFVTAKGNILKVTVTEDDQVYLLYTGNDGGNKETNYIAKLDVDKKRIVDERSIPYRVSGIYPGEEGAILIVSDEFILSLKLGSDELKKDVDLKVQGIAGTSIRYVGKHGRRLDIVGQVESNNTVQLFLYSLTPTSESGMPETEKETNRFSPDGRKVITIAIPESYPWNIEYHAKVYNQTSSEAFVEIVRFDENQETYLGKGERPDGIALDNSAQAGELGGKRVLADLYPFFEKSEKYAQDDIEDKVIEALTFDGCMYAMSGYYRLLLRTSDGTEYDSNGRCTAADYLKWYDDYLTKEKIEGCGEIDDVLFADICSYIDLKKGEADFESEDFKTLLSNYKDVKERHTGELSSSLSREKGWGVRRCAEGPMWYPGWGALEFTDKGFTAAGLPTRDGGSKVYMRISYPFGILETSENKQQVFDFIMDYERLNYHLYRGNPEADYGHSASTPAMLSSFKAVMDEDIYNTELPFAFLMSDSGAITEFKFTDDQKELLRKMIAEAEPETNIHKAVCDIVMDEIPAFLGGGKTVEETCKLIQNRVSLYLSEK